MALAAIYLVLLACVVIFFLLHYLALAWLARRLRQAHPKQWQIIARDEAGQPVGVTRRWLRLQNALRSPVLPALGDASLTRVRTLWRVCPWLAWTCLAAAFALRWLAA